MPNTDVVNTIQVGTSYQYHTSQLCPTSKPRPLLVLAHEQVVCDAWHLSAALCCIKHDIRRSDACHRVTHCCQSSWRAAFKAGLTDQPDASHGNFHEVDGETTDTGFKIASWKVEWKETNLNKDQRIFRKKPGRIVRWRSVLAPMKELDCTWLCLSDGKLLTPSISTIFPFCSCFPAFSSP